MVLEAVLKVILLAFLTLFSVPPEEDILARAFITVAWKEDLAGVVGWQPFLFLIGDAVDNVGVDDVNRDNLEASVGIGIMAKHLHVK